MSKSRVIRKYPNRRLYDTEESRYITLADVRDLVINNVDFEVIDKKTGDDITRTILLQVISEQEATGDPVMSKDFLSQVIRAYETVMPGFMARYLEQSLKLFMSQQQFLRGQVKRVVGVDPVTIVADMTQKNFARFRSLQDEVFQRFSLTAGDTDDAQAPDDEPAAKPPKASGKPRKTG
jgi:polyhydroxyalkanoate synthesis repressor PhaR